DPSYHLGELEHSARARARSSLMWPTTTLEWPKVEQQVCLLDHQDPAGAPFRTLEVALTQVDPRPLGMRLDDLLERPEQCRLLRIVGERSESAVEDGD